MLRGICCILLAVAIFAPVVRKLYKWNRVTDEQRVAAQAGLVDPGSSQPEPAERKAYLFGCLLAPVLIFGLTLALRRHVEPRLGQLPRWLTASTQFALLAALVAYAWWLVAGDDYFPLGLNLLYCYPWAIVPLLLVRLPVLMWLGRPSPLSRWFSRLVVAGPLAAIVLAGWLSQSDGYVLNSIHFTAVYDPVSQVQLGKNLLGDYGSQYGLYPDFLAPLFAVIGLSVGRFTFVMALLTAGSFGLLWLVLRDAIPRRSVALLGFVALAFNGWLMFQVRSVDYHPDFLDPYYQYLPLRFVFPACAIGLTWFYFQQGRSRRLYWAAHLILAAGLLWNLDSGLVAQGAWLAALLFHDLFEATWFARARRVVEHLGAAALAIITVVAGYSLIKYACYGVWPSWEHLFDYQRAFYWSGFYMLPMHFRGTWQLVVIVYLAGLAYGAAALATGQRGARPTLVVMLSVLGLGLFSYYQGRSHELCLILCWWPALVLLPIFLDELLDARLQRQQVLAYGLAAAVGVFLLGSAASFAAQTPTLCRMTSRQLVRFFSPEAPLAAEAQMLRERVAPGDGVLVLSGCAPLVESAAQVQSLAPASMVQMLWMSQYDDLLAALERRSRSWVFIDRQFADQFFVSPKNNAGSQMLLTAISPRLRKVAETEGGALYEFFGSASVRAIPAAPQLDTIAAAELGETDFKITAASFQFVRGLPR